MGNDNLHFCTFYSEAKSKHHHSTIIMKFMIMITVQEYQGLYPLIMLSSMTKILNDFNFETFCENIRKLASFIIVILILIKLRFFFIMQIFFKLHTLHLSHE